MKYKSCAFTGHRPKSFPWHYNESDPRCIALKETLAQQVTRLSDIGIITYLSGMAIGADTWFSLAVLALREENPLIQLHCVLPCHSQDIKWPYESKMLYHSILSRADHIIYVNDTYTKNCMLQRNHYMVDHADVLLAVYNGERKGGTAATVRYARNLNRDIFIIDPITRLVTYENTPEECR